MMEIGEFAWAELYLDEAIATAQALGDERLRADAILTRLLVGHHTLDDLSGWRNDVERETTALIPALERLEATAELAKAWRMVAFRYGTVCRWEDAADAQQRALGYAQRAGKRRQEARLAAAYTISLSDGPTEVGDAIARCEEILAGGLVDQQAEAIALTSVAYLYALQGSFPEARDHCRRAQTLLDTLGASVLAAQVAIARGRIELLAGDALAAERDLRSDFDALGALGERYIRPFVGALLARALIVQDRADEAEAVVGQVAEIADEEDVEAQAMLRAVQARLATRRGEETVAIELAREAVRLIETTDAPIGRAEALLELAHVLSAAGQIGDARATLEQARDLAALKAARPLDERVAALLEQLSASVL
jgi:ATP/maltotriose-dependent transcriptional regulator MalT